MNKHDDASEPLESNALLACLQIGKLLTSTMNTREVLRLIMNKVSELIPASNWSLLLRDEKTNMIKFEVVVGIDFEQVKDIRIPPGKGIAGKVAESGQALFIEDAQNDPRFFHQVDKDTGFTTRSIVCLPLKIHGEILGVLEVINAEDIEQFRAKYLPVLIILIDYAAIALDNARNFDRIRKMSITDEYTGLYNARYLYDILARLTAKRQSLGVIFIDVDNFKNVVDTYGHLSGSHVLREIGATIKSCLGENDYLIKYGGDEYIILLPACDKKRALAVAETILNRIRNETYLRSESTAVQLTASFGIAMYPEDAQTEKDLLLKADHLMYRIKKSSKNGIQTT